MCGIVGWIDWKDDLTHQGMTIERMVKTVHLQPLLDLRSVRAVIENKVTSPVVLISLAERIIQINEWLKHYRVTLSL